MAKRKKRSATKKKKRVSGIPHSVRRASSTIKKHLHKLQKIKSKEEACLKKTNSQISELKKLI